MRPGCLILTATILRSSTKASRRQNIVHQGQPHLCNATSGYRMAMLEGNSRPASREFSSVTRSSLARSQLIGGKLNVSVRVPPPIFKCWVGVWQVPSPHLIAMICIFHGADRARVALYLDKNGVEPSCSLCMAEEVVSDPAHELVPILRGRLVFMSTYTADWAQESKTTGL